MNGWLIDTNVVTEISRFAGHERVVAWAKDQDRHRVFISVLTLAEYDKGIHKLLAASPMRARLAQRTASMETSFAGRILPLSDDIVRRWGRMSGEIQQRTGRAPQVIDAMLAATAIEHGLYLVTRNVKDMRRCGASVFNPWRDDPAAFPMAN